MSWLLEQDDAKRLSRAEQVATFPDEVQAEARRLLASPNLLGMIALGIEAAGVAGEHLLALTVYLAGTSRLLDRPLALIIQGPSSSGKSYVLDAVAKLFPPDEVFEATDLTPQALYYLPAGALVHRFVVAGERVRDSKDAAGQGTKSLREMISSGRLVKVVTVSDADGPKTVQIHQSGPIAYAESTTATNLYEEDANRCLILQSDERPEQTRRILLAHGRHHAGNSRAEEKQRWQSLLQCLQTQLEPLPVVIPYAEALSRLVPAERLEMRRTYGHVLSMISTLALLHQLQRDRDAAGRIITSPVDYWYARRLLNDTLSRSLGHKSADALKHFVERMNGISGEYTVRQLTERIPYSERTIREHLQALLELGLVDQSEPGRGPIPAKWMIPGKIELAEETQTILPDVASVCGVEEDALVLSEMPAEWGSADLTSVPF